MIIYKQPRLIVAKNGTIVINDTCQPQAIRHMFTSPLEDNIIAVLAIQIVYTIWFL